MIDLSKLLVRAVVVIVRSVRQLWNKTTTEIRFFISSLAADAQKHAEVIRRHWSIENSLHIRLKTAINSLFMFRI